MVRRPPDSDSRDAGLTVRKRDGRVVAFDGRKIAASIEAALHAVDATEAGGSVGRDLAQVVERSLGAEVGGVAVGTQEAGCAEATSTVRHAPVEVADITRRVDDVLTGSGYERAAYAFAAVGQSRRHSRAALRIRDAGIGDGVRGIPGTPEVDPGEWSKGRIVRLLETEAALDPALAEDIAAAVERGVFGAGLRTVSPALLREWVDNELTQRGLSSRLGAHRMVGLPSHELREILASGRAGPQAEREIASRVCGQYALREVYPDDVAAAHERGLLLLEDLPWAGRVDTAVLPLSALLPALPGVAGMVLRNLARLCARELVVLWDTEGAGPAEAAALFEQVCEPGLSEGAVAPIRFAVDASPRAEVAEAFVTALEQRGVSAPHRGRPPGLRLGLVGLPEPLLLRALALEEVSDAVDFVVALPRPRVGSTSITLNLARVGLRAGRGGTRAFLDGVGELATLAVDGLAARGRMTEPVTLPLATLAASLGAAPDLLGSPRPRLALAGLRAAAHVLAGDARRADDLLGDLAAAVGERLERVSPDRPVRESAGPAVRRLFGTADLAAHPEGRDLLPLSTARDGYRYDQAWLLPPGGDPAAVGARAARVAARLGFVRTAPLPRSTGGRDARLTFLRCLHAAARPDSGISSPCV